MNEQGIRKLRNKFIQSALITLTLVMFLMGTLIYIANLTITRQSIHRILNFIVENDGELEGTKTETVKNPVSSGSSETAQEQGGHSLDSDDYSVVRFLYEIFGTETIEKVRDKYETRYFAVLYDPKGNVTVVKNNLVDSVTQEEAETYGRIALEKERSFGRSGTYYYQVERRDDGSCIVVYLDSTLQVEAMNRLLYSALLLIGFGMILASVFVTVFANRAIRPEVENAELQKRFITNASHELKTPLAVIKANTEMQEILDGESEWTRSTLRQVERLTGLIQNLVMITRAQEQEDREEFADTDVSAVVQETADTFRPVAIQEGKTLTCETPDDLHMEAAASQIRQLTSLLVDNAIKYCDDKGEVKVRVYAVRKGIQLQVSNPYADGKNVDYSRFFERFYREDQSHHADSEKGGYGIGLSIAESLVEQYHGSIQASWKDGVICFTCLLKNKYKKE